MKTTLLFALLMAMSTFAASQKTIETQPVEVMYLVGSDHMPEYKIELKKCSTKGQIILSNGRTAPALNCFIVDKKDYIGGTLISSDNTTEIVDIKMEPLGESGAKFIVMGKSFDMSFTLVDGMILRIGGEEVIFHTEGKGVWKISKKS